MIVAKIRVSGAVARTVWAQPITVGMVGVKVQIDYTADWEGLTKTVVFRGAVTKDVITDAAVVDIPAECLATAGAVLIVGVYGVDKAQVLAIPTLRTKIGIVQGGASPSGDETTDPALPVWAQILETANRAETVASEAANAASTAAADAQAGAESANTAAVTAAEAAAAALDAANNANAAAGMAEAEANNANAAAQAAAEASSQALEAAGAAEAVVESIVPEVDCLKRDLSAEIVRAKSAEDNRIKKFYTGNLGAVSIADSDDGAVRNLVIYGKSWQEADPSPDNPQEIKSVENCTVTISNADGTETQSAPIPVTLRSIGDVRDKLYVYADGSGKLVQWVNSKKISSGTDMSVYTSVKDTVTNFRTSADGVDKIFRKPGSSYTGYCVSNILPFNNDIWHQEVAGIRAIENNAIDFALPYSVLGITSDATGAERVNALKAFTQDNDFYIIFKLIDPIETILTAEQVKALFDLRTCYGGTNISFQSDNGVEPAVNFDYACALENFVEYIKTAQGDDREMIYDMDERMTDAEYVAALAYVNSEYAAALTELEV